MKFLLGQGFLETQSVNRTDRRDRTYYHAAFTRGKMRVLDMLLSDIPTRGQVPSFPSVIWLTEIWHRFLLTDSTLSLRQELCNIFIGRLFVKCPRNGCDGVT